MISEQRRSDLIDIMVPFGLLSPDVQADLKDICNGQNPLTSNIQRYNGEWCKVKPAWIPSITYRLDPEWTPKPEKAKAVRCMIRNDGSGNLIYGENDRPIRVASTRSDFMGFEYESDDGEAYLNSSIVRAIRISDGKIMGNFGLFIASMDKYEFRRPIAVWFSGKIAS